MLLRRHTRQQWLDKLFRSLCYLALLSGLTLLFTVLFTIIKKAYPGLSWHLFTNITSGPFGVGGMANAFMGSLILVALAMLISIPIGVGAAIYCVEYGKKNKFVKLLRYANDILLSIPSIIIGLFVYALVVIPTHHFSAWAGSIALALIAIPIIARTTEDVLYLVSPQLREAGLALGIAHYKLFFIILFKTARSGIVTGIMLAIARIAGETAPLLFTSLNNNFMNYHLNQPIASVPVVVYHYALSPYKQWQDAAWAAIAVMTIFIIVCNLLAKYSRRKSHQDKRG